jgi:hypothetical protein
MSRVLVQAVYIAVLQGSAGQPTASCLRQLSTSKCWRVLWMCSTEMERFWWRSYPATWMGQNLTSLRTWPCVLWTTLVVSVVPVGCLDEALNAFLLRYTLNARATKMWQFCHGRRERVRVQWKHFSGHAANQGPKEVPIKNPSPNRN